MGIHSNVFTAVIAGRQHQQFLFQCRKQNIIDLRAGAIELVIDQRKSFPTGQRQARIDPVLPQFILNFDDTVDEVIHHFFARVAGLVANQVGGFEFVISKDQHNGTGKQVR
jgi:hypothetical protein